MCGIGNICSEKSKCNTETIINADSVIIAFIKSHLMHYMTTHIEKNIFNTAIEMNCDLMHQSMRELSHIELFIITI